MAQQPAYKITALKCGTLRLNKTSMTYASGPEKTINVPVWAAAVEGGGLKILVDTGISDHDQWGDDCWRDEDETIEAALSEIGWRISDVDMVINSHLHWDHAENNTRFAGSRFVVSRAEWEYAKDPIPSQRKLYDFSWTDESTTYMDYQLIAVDDFDLEPGIRLIKTPGHTRGHQSVLVNTTEGIVCVAGDAACLPENFSAPTPPGGATSIEQAFRSLDRIRDTADRVFMNHDPNIAKYQDSGFLIVPHVGDALPEGSVESLPPRIIHDHH
jgi:glyoxylase-like metal-dependent hydrolase (beta-lactamase superfamily II)